MRRIRVWGGWHSPKALVAAVLLATTSSLLAEPRTVVVGVYENPPKISLSTDGKPTGILGDTLMAMAQKERWDVQARSCVWADCLKLLQAGEIDLLPDVALTEERRGVFQFGKVPALTVWSQFYGRDASRIHDFARLAGTRIAVLKGSVQETHLQDLLAGFRMTATVIPVATIEDGFRLTAQGQADYAIANRYFGDAHSERYHLVASPIVFQPARLYYAAPVGKNGELLRTIDGHLAKWRADEKSPLSIAHTKWTVGPVAPRELPLWVWAGSATLLLVSLVALGFNRLLRQQVAEKTGQLQDLVTARSAELALAQSELAQRAARLAELYDRAPCGYLTIDRQGVITEVNQTLLTMLGYDAHEVIGKEVSAFLTARSWEQFRQKLATVEAGYTSRQVDYDLVRKDSRVIPVLASADVGGPDTQWVRAVVVDNTERLERERLIHRIQEQLAERTEAAERASAAKSIFLANMSHEIRTPMNAILGYTHLLQREATDAHLSERLEKIDRAGQYLLQLINDVLDLTKIEAGMAKLEEVDFCLEDLLGKCVELLADRIKDKQLAFSVHNTVPRILLKGDSTRMTQALVNLLSNAVKFTDAGFVRLEVSVVSHIDDRLQLCMKVHDSGPGLDPDKHERLFNSFEQADGSITRRFGGTGLGLSLTKHLARLMGGDVGVESTVGAGSTFWFTAWVQESDAKPVEKISDQERAQQIRQAHAGKRVLVAEDNLVNAEILCAILQNLGLQTSVAENGRQAVDLALHAPVDLVLMDVQMPDLDGLSATRSLRAAGFNKPIVAVSASAFRDEQQACFDAGMNDHLSKPIIPQQLYEVLLESL